MEPNNITSVNLPRRSRYYQALIDVKLLDSGVDYDDLPDMWTIWILPYDPFGLNYMLYSVKNIVEEDNEIDYNDGVRKLFLYTGGAKGGTDSLRALLQYIENSVAQNAVDDDLRQLHSNVQRLKSRRDIGVKYMNMQEVMEYHIKIRAEEAAQELAQEMAQEMAQGMAQSMAQGMAQGMAQKIVQETVKEATKNTTQKMTEKMSKLMNVLLTSGRGEDLKRSAEDPEFLAKLLLEFNP